MAMVLDAFASYVQDTLTEMAKEEVGMLLGVSGEIDKMSDKLGDLKKFLADADKKNVTDKSVQGWVTELKRAMYDATDILDLCQLKAMEQGPSTVDVGCFNPLLFCLRNPLHAHDIGTRIKALNQKLDAIKERSAAFNFINLGSYEDRSSSVHISRVGNARRGQESTGDFDRLGVVGEKIEEDTRKLVNIMTTRTDGETSHVDNRVTVFAVVGVGGIGKTTLAQKIFNDEAIQREFDQKIWLSVNQDFREVELLRRAITEAGGDYRSAGDAKHTLERTLKDVLRGKKILLVMDDVWDTKAWEAVLKTPVVNAAALGSRVLVTTRDERVARGIKAVPPYHHIDKLDDKDAWSLLKKQVVSSERDRHEVDMLKDIGLKIIAKCDGLPLAVKVIGGLLCKREKRRGDWEMVLNDSKWSISEMPQELNDAVYLSYEDLPPCIKQCLLYYSLLLRTTLFYRDDIVCMWISEGFLHGTSGDLEELGRKYHTELILRNLIEPDTGYVDQCVCNMHDVVRSFAQFMARDEALAAHSGETDLISKLGAQKFLRLSLESKVSESDGLGWCSLRAQKTLRTLILVGHIDVKPGDSLVDFPCLRTLYTNSGNVAVLVESLDQLKHLRFLSIQNSDISRLPDSIGRMKLLQHIDLYRCGSLVKLPDSIVKLGQLRYLNLSRTGINGIPRGFCALTNLRRLGGFPAQVVGDWCSLEELGPLFQLRGLGLKGLKNVSTASSATKAKLGEKVHLTELFLRCSSRLGNDGLIKEEGGVSEEEQRRTEEVFDELCPPPSLDYLEITGYFGRRLPRWMTSTSASSLKILRILMLEDLACCTQLPDGLSQLSCLEFIQIRRAPSVKRVGPEFLQPYHLHFHHPSQAAAAFPRLHEINLIGMVEWEEWEWEEQVQAMPVLEVLLLAGCKLRCVPPGLAANAMALKKLHVLYVKQLSYLENFTFVVELEVTENPDLERITNLPNLHKLQIKACPKLKALEGVHALQRLILEDYDMETLPEYLRDINPRHLEVCCSLASLTSIAAGQSGPEWDKFSHDEHVKVYARDGDNERKWYVLYTREPCSLDTNINCSFLSGGTLSFFKDEQGFESVFKMTRRTFSYVCSLVKVPSLKDMNSYNFFDGRVMCLEDRVAVALIMLNSGEPPEAVGSSVGLNELTVSLVTQSFVEAMLERMENHLRWPACNEMEKIKSKFDKIHGLPNCCGVVHTTHIPFLSKFDHEKNNGVLALIDPDMRFTNIVWGLADSINQSSMLHESGLLELCEKGKWLNGSKLNVSAGSEVGEYIIGDAGYPLFPWLLTPYQEDDLSDSPYKAEFNKRHSAATTFALRALARLEDTWKCLHEATWCSNISPDKLGGILDACCMLHNIVIGMEEAGMPSDQEVNYSEQVRQLADEDAVRARDILSQHLIESRVDEEEEQEIVPSDSGGEEKEQQEHTRTGEEGKQC